MLLLLLLLLLVIMIIHLVNAFQVQTYICPV